MRTSLITLAAALAMNASAALAGEPAGTASASLAQGVGMPGEIQTATTFSHDPVRSRFERLSEGDIKQYYLACSGEAIGRRIGSGDIKVCSIAYDVLLTRHFGGNFMALLAWSQAHETSHSSD